LLLCGLAIAMRGLQAGAALCGWLAAIMALFCALPLLAGLYRIVKGGT
jgi:hypothetical protein